MKLGLFEHFEVHSGIL